LGTSGHAVLTSLASTYKFMETLAATGIVSWRLLPSVFRFSLIVWKFTLIIFNLFKIHKAPVIPPGHNLLNTL
jgi:hypothetical protein